MREIKYLEKLKGIFLKLLFSVLGSKKKSDPCSLFYRGMEAESEPCVHTYATILRRKQKLLQAYFTLHSFYELLFIPNSYTRKPPSDIAEIVSFLEELIKFIIQNNIW